ncbi:MAG: DNA repair protein RadC [Candidatus Brocadiaceae bacterium]|nr:DNA repair protein RadC [Candidatus Brocadiaceae bacterium]
MKSKITRESKGIVSWPEEERPRERLLSRGPHALTDAELIGILVRVGFQGTNAVELGRQLLKKFGSLRAMAEAPLSAMLDIKGLKGAKVAQLSAAMEIARRVSLPDKRKQLLIKGTSQAGEYLKERLRGLPDEHFRVLYLNRRNRLLDDVLIAQGEVDGVKPPLRSIINHALRTNTSSLIAAHNHPSGLTEPSESDIILTRDLISATRPLGMKILDHIIVGEETTYSFADSGLLDELELESFSPYPAKRNLKRIKASP